MFHVCLVCLLLETCLLFFEVFDCFGCVLLVDFIVFVGRICWLFLFRLLFAFWERSHKGSLVWLVFFLCLLLTLFTPFWSHSCLVLHTLVGCFVMLIFHFNWFCNLLVCFSFWLVQELVVEGLFMFWGGVFCEESAWRTTCFRNLVIQKDSKASSESFH